MRTIDQARVSASLEATFEAASDVERWPEWLPHYRWVRFLERRENGGLVEMAAVRPFGSFQYPTWWVSEMAIERDRPLIRYRHVRGITRGMDVTWEFRRLSPDIDVTITHVWDGPEWPLIGSLAAEWVIGPVFVHGIASRTLAGVKRRAESTMR